MSMKELKAINRNGYVLLAIAAAMIAIHFTVLMRKSVDSNIINLHFLLFFGIASLVWEERANIKLQSGFFATLLGTFLICIVLLRALTPIGYDITSSPLIVGLGLSLLISGIYSLKYFKKELILLSLTAFYPRIGDFFNNIGITKATAQASSFLLWLCGFSVHHNGLEIILPKARVEVLTACAGLDSMMLIITITMFFYILVRTKLVDKIICMIIAILISFWLNSVRIAILAILANSGDKKGFDYWHGGDGSLIFSVISVGVFAIFCWLFYVRKAIKKLDNVTPNKLLEDENSTID